MTNYHIKEFGSAFVVGTDDEEILVCVDRKVATQIAIQAQEILRARQRIAELIARETGKSLKLVLEDIDRDHWLSAQEAIDYGLVGRIVKGREEL